MFNALELGHHRANTGIHNAPGLVSGLHGVRSGFMAIDAVRHATDDAVLICLFGQFR